MNYSSSRRPQAGAGAGARPSTFGNQAATRPVIFDDRRPWFSVTVTGHPDAIPDDGWTASPLLRDSFTQPGAAEVRSYLDAVLWRRRASHRVQVYCRCCDAGIDAIVRAYGELRKIPCMPLHTSADVYGDHAELHRDLELLARSHAVVWFGPRLTDGPDLVTLALWLAIPCRVVPLPAHIEEDE